MPSLQRKRFARWLRDARQRAELTQEKMAEYLDVAQPTYSQWEVEGRQWMEPEQVIRLATILHVSGMDVLRALGYPVHQTDGAMSPCPSLDEDDPISVMKEMARLNVRLQQIVEAERRADRAAQRS